MQAEQRPMIQNTHTLRCRSSIRIEQGNWKTLNLPYVFTYSPLHPRTAAALPGRTEQQPRISISWVPRPSFHWIYLNGRTVGRMASLSWTEAEGKALKKHKAKEKHRNREI